jgi:hypothetical protein
MQFNYGNSANYLAGGAQVANTYIDTYDTSQKTGTDINKLVQTESKRRTQQRKNAINQVTTVGDAAVDIQTGVKLTDMDAKLKKDIRNINRPAKMAGALAATVDTGNAYLMYDKERKLKLKEDAEYKAAGQTQMDLMKKSFEAQMELMNKRSEAETLKLAKLRKEFNQSGTQPTNTSDTPQTISSNSTALPVQAIAPSGGNVDRQEVYTYLTKTHGLSKNKALGVMANIDRESTFRSNPAGGDGGNSFGMLQWNNTYGRSDLMKKNVPDFATNWKGQLDHALSQNQLPEYNQFISKFKNTTYNSPQAASEAFLRNWERPADVAGGIAKNNQFIAGYNYQ